MTFRELGKSLITPDVTEAIRLDVLGSPIARDARGRLLGNLLQQPKRLAILVYLALQPGFVRRDVLLALAWPEAGSAQARRALTQALHFLRRNLGAGAVISRGDEIAVSAERVVTDVAAFRQATSGGRFGDAVNLYRGELLAGVHVFEAPALSEWLDQERTKLRREAVLSACAHASNLERAAAWTAAEVAARRATEIDPTDETAARLLIRVLFRGGSPASALQAFEQFRSRLDSEYGLEPSTETIRLVDSIRTGTVGSQFTPTRSRRPESPRSLAEPTARESVGERSRPAWIPTLVNSALLVLALSAFAAVLARSGGSAPSAASPHRSERHRIAVLYFTPQSPLDSVGHLADALTEALIDQLTAVSAFEVVSATGVQPFRRRDVPVETITQQLSPHSLVFGSISRHADGIRVQARLSDGQTHAVLRTVVFQASPNNPIELIEGATASIADALRVAIGQTVAIDQWKSGTSSALAWELTQRANELTKSAHVFTSEGRIAEGARHQQQADSLLALAAHEDRAWSVPPLLRAMIAEASALQCLHNSGCTAETAIERLRTGVRLATDAITRNPRDANAAARRGSLHHLLSVASSESSEISHYATQAERDLLDAIAHDPKLSEAWSRLSAIQYARGDFQAAVLSARQAYESDAFLANTDEILGRLFLSSLHLLDDTGAAYWCSEILRRSSGRWPAAFCTLNLMAYANNGASVDNIWTVIQEHVESDPAASTMRPRLEMLAAAVLAREGRNDSAKVIIARAKADAGTDPELPVFEAAALLAAGSTSSADSVLDMYIAERPHARAAIRRWRWFRNFLG